MIIDSSQTETNFPAKSLNTPFDLPNSNTTLTWKMRASQILTLLETITTMKELTQTHSLMTKTGLTNLPKLLLFTAISPSGNLQYAHSLFTFTIPKTPFLYNTMIRAYSHSAYPIKSLHLYNHMYLNHVKPDSFTYTFTLKACGKILSQIRENGEEKNELACMVVRKGGEMHCKVVKHGLYLDDFVMNSLVFMYGQCGLAELSRLVFDEMPGRNISSWNTMIAVYDAVNEFESANELLKMMPEKNVVSWNTLIARYVKAGDIEAARRVFSEMPERDVISWNSMISGYVQRRGFGKAMEMYREMCCNGVDGTEVTFLSVLGACAEMGDLKTGREIHEILRRKGVMIEGYLGNAIVDMYAKCGSLDLAREVFDGMRMRHVSCWNSMIMGLAVHGYTEEALELFCSMESEFEEAVPNRITFIGVLIACSHKGLIKEGYYYFYRMTAKYSIRPDIKHYGCMVDLLSRWGMLNEAYNVIIMMPFVGNSLLWRTLLGACRTYKNVELAEKAFEKIVELESPTDADCVLLSNIYAEMERWEDVEKIRNIMIRLGVSKRPGSSHIELKYKSAL